MITTSLTRFRNNPSLGVIFILGLVSWRLDATFPLHLAVLRGDVEAVVDLFSNGVYIDVNEANKKLGGKTALHLALQFKQRETLVWLLIHKGANIRVIDGCGATPLHYAVTYSQYNEIVKFLIESGADVNATNNKGETPLYEATKRKHVEQMKMLVYAGALVEDRTLSLSKSLAVRLRKWCMHYISTFPAFPALPTV